MPSTVSVFSKQRAVVLLAIYLTLPEVTLGAAGRMREPSLTSAQMISAEKTAMLRLSAIDGTWRGPGWMIDHPGEAPRRMTDTFRVGSFLGGTLKIIEERDYMDDGTVGFNALFVISFDAQKSEYIIRAWGGGRSGDFSYRLVPGGYIWNIGASDRGLRYRGEIRNGRWHEVGELVADGRAPIRISEWTVRRIAGTDWPVAGAVTQK